MLRRCSSRAARLLLHELFVEMHFTHRTNADRNSTDICTPEETAHREAMYMPCLSWHEAYKWLQLMQSACIAAHNWHQGSRIFGS